MKIARRQLRTPQRAPRTRQAAKLSGPACCPDCGAIYRRGRWRWEEVPAAAKGQRCPACQRIRDRDPAASVTLSGDFVAAHRDEIVARLRACERAENSTRPLQRIIAIAPAGSGLRVTTTDTHLARRIGAALSGAYKGDIEQRYHPRDPRLRVSWWR